MANNPDFLRGIKEFRESVDRIGLGPKKRAPDRTPEHKTALTKLRTTVSRITDKDLKSYLQEAVKCYDNNCLRAAIVLVWITTMETLFNYVQKKRWIRKFDSEFKRVHGNSKHYRPIKKKENLLYVKDSIIILTFETIGVYNRSVRKRLETYLNLRNECGHPTRYEPGDYETGVYIEYLVDNIISKY